MNDKEIIVLNVKYRFHLGNDFNHTDLRFNKNNIPAWKSLLNVDGTFFFHKSIDYTGNKPTARKDFQTFHNYE